MTRRMAWLVFVGVVAAACASGFKMEPPPPSAQRIPPAWLVGTWEGAGYKVGAGSVPLQGTITLTFQVDGAWKGITQSGTSSGTSWLDDDEIVLDGAMANGAPIRYTLKVRENSDSSRDMWGVLQTRFGTAMVSLKRVR
jgi:hypothetical protein